MKRITLIVPIVLLILASIACQGTIPNLPSTVRGSGIASTEVREVSDFSAISLKSMGDVYITIGKTESLSIQADDNLLPLLTTEVQGGVLELGTVRNKNINPTEPIVYNITVKELNNITLAGSGNFYVDSFETDQMTITLAGSGDINLDSLDTPELKATIAGSGNIFVDELTTENVDATISGSGNIRLAGEAPTQRLNIFGSGDYLAGDFQTETTSITIAGSGNVTIWVTEQLTTSINGSGDIKYYGKPSISQSGSGSGNLIALGSK